MAIVTLTGLYSRLPNWDGALLQGMGSSIAIRGPGIFAYTLGPDSGFEGYEVTLRGTGFAYAGQSPVAGTLASVTLTDTDGTTLLAIEGISPTSIASDLGAFCALCFGITGTITSPQIQNAWSLLLSGSDTFVGTDDNDIGRLPGLNAGHDLFAMGAGDDWVGGSLGDDTINGGAGYDQLSYDPSTFTGGMAAVRGIVVDVMAGTVLDPYGNTDRVSGVEVFTGTTFADQFHGSDGQNSFIGLRGADTCDGGGGEDWLRYHLDDAFGGNQGITVTLQSALSGGQVLGWIKDGFGSTDQTCDIENVTGTRFDDSFTGSRASNHFAGGAGRDRFDGKGGSDWIDFDGPGLTPPVGVAVNLSRLARQIVNDGFGNAEEARSIENITGSTQNDRIKGSAEGNHLIGGLGADTLTGGGGADVFIFNARGQAGQGDRISDFHAGPGPAQDVLQFAMIAFGGTATAHLMNGSAPTQAKGTFLFNPSNHVLYWDDDGTGFNTAQAVVTLNGVTALSAANFDLI